MLDCPACGSPNEDLAQRCSRCGANLLAVPTLGAAPDANRFANAAAPTAIPADPDRQMSKALSVTDAQRPGTFAPIEPGPSTLAGPWLTPDTSGSPSTDPVRQEVTDGPRTLSGIANPQARTMMGFGPVTPELAPRPTASTGPTTVRGLGLSEPLPPATSQLNQASKPSPMRGTLLGVSPMATPFFTTAESEPKPARLPENLGATRPIAGESGPPHGAPSSLAKEQVLHKTMLGVAPPVPLAMPERHAGSVVNPFGMAGNHKGTLLGVAMPGIAPLNPGTQKPEPAVLPQATPAWTAGAPEVAPLRPSAIGMGSVPPEAQAHNLQRSLQRSRLAWILGAASTVLLLIVAIAALVFKTRVHLSVQVRASEAAGELLVIACSNCPDGTTVSYGGRSGLFSKNQAQLSLPQRLSIGDNRLALDVKRPDRKRSEIIDVTVPVAFRVTSDLAGLSEEPPQVVAVIEAVPQTSLQVEGQRLVVGANGKSIVRVDVAQHLTGPSGNHAQFEHRLNYVVTQQDGTTTPGTLVTRMPITPLEVAAPGLDFITQNATFALSGRTSPKATLTANGHTLTVATDGRFRQDMALSAPGATRLRLRAHEEGHAPRTVEIGLERVTSLRMRADELLKTIPSNYDAVTAAVGAQPNTLVALEGEVVALEVVGPETRIAISSDCRNAPCLASIRLGAPLSLKHGEKIVAIGHGRLTKRGSTDKFDLSLDASMVVEGSTH